VLVLNLVPGFDSLASC